MHVPDEIHLKQEPLRRHGARSRQDQGFSQDLNRKNERQMESELGFARHEPLHLINAFLVHTLIAHNTHQVRAAQQ